MTMIRDTANKSKHNDNLLSVVATSAKDRKFFAVLKNG